MPLFVKQEVLDATQTELATLRESLDTTKAELTSTLAILHDTDKRFEALTQLQTVKDAKYEELKKLAQRFEEDSHKAQAALDLQTTKAMEAISREKDKYESRLATLARESKNEIEALRAELDTLRGSLDSEVSANELLRTQIADLRHDLFRIQGERDTLEATQRRVRTDSEAQIQAAMKAGAARVKLLENELAGHKGT